MPLNKKQDSLFSLVKSLTKNEKRFFTLYSQLFYQNKTANYVHLFNILDNISDYNQELVLKKLGKHTSTKHFTQIKRYLKIHLLESLKQYHKKNDEGIQILDQIARVQVLKEKGLMEHSEEILKKQWEHTKSTERNESAYLINLELIKLEEKKEVSSESQKKTTSYFLESIDIINQSIELLQLKNILMQLRLLLYNKEKIANTTNAQLNAILENELLVINPNELKSYTAQYMYYLCCSCIYMNTNNSNELLKVIEAQYKLLQTPPYKDNTKANFLARINLLGAYIINKDFTKCTILIEELKKILVGIPNPQSKYIYWYYLRQIQYYTAQENPFFPAILISKILKDIDDPKIDMSSANQNGLLFGLGKYYFKNEQIKKAQDILLQIILIRKISANDYYYLQINLLNIICLYELNLTETVNRELLSLTRKLTRENLISPTLKKFFKLIKQINNTLYNPKKEQRYYNEIGKLITEAKSKNHSTLDNLEFLTWWIEKKQQILGIAENINR